jgi:hypothetical protein
VIAADGLAKARFVSVDVGVFATGVGSDGAGLGELVDFFWKNPNIDFWFFADCDADAGCFFCEARGVDISFPSMPRAMVAILCGVEIEKKVTEVREGRVSLRCSRAPGSLSGEGTDERDASKLVYIGI